MIDAVFFDLDGTLADTCPDMARTVNVMRHRRGLAPVAEAHVRPHVSRGARGMILAAFEITAEHPDFTAMRDEFLEIYGANLCVGTRLFPGMEALLERLERSGIAWGVVTNKPKIYTDALLRALRLDRRAAVVVSADEAQKPKPAPDPLLLACFRTIAVTWGYEGEHPIRSWGADAGWPTSGRKDIWQHHPERRLQFCSRERLRMELRRHRFLFR